MIVVRFVSFALALAALAALPATARAASDPQALFARERRASGGDAWNAIVALKTDGVVTSGGAPSPFAQLLDLRTGATKGTTKIGPVTDVSGYDGVAWDYQGSTVTVQTLPGTVADNVTQAYVGRNGWWRNDGSATFAALGASGPDDGVRVVPRNGSAIDVFFNRGTGLIDRTIAHTDGGAVVTTIDDYRTLGSIVVSFHSLETDPTGATTDTQADTIVPLRSVAADAFARPLPRYLGHIAGGAASAVVPFRFDPAIGWMSVDLLVGGRPSNVIFDSGGANVFSRMAAARLRLHGSGGLPVSGAGNGSINVQVAHLGTLSLGSALLDDQNGIVAPLPYDVTHPAARVDVDGLIGAEFLHNLRITFDFAPNRITLEPYTHARTTAPGGVTVPFFTDGAHAYVSASVDGVPGLYLLDTGDAGAFTVFRRFADAHALFHGASLTYLTPGGVGGHLPVKVYRASTFALGGATFHAPPIQVSYASAGSFASRTIAGNIGIRVLSRYRLTFDFADQTVTFVPSARIADPFTEDRTGMSFDQPNASSFVVLSVVAGSPAANAGLHAGDTIVTVNGASIAGMKLGRGDLARLAHGTNSYTLTTQAKDGTRATVTIHPRALLP